MTTFNLTTPRVGSLHVMVADGKAVYASLFLCNCVLYYLKVMTHKKRAVYSFLLTLFWRPQSYADNADVWCY